MNLADILCMNNFDWRPYIFEGRYVRVTCKAIHTGFLLAEHNKHAPPSGSAEDVCARGSLAQIKWTLILKDDTFEQIVGKMKQCDIALFAAKHGRVDLLQRLQEELSYEWSYEEYGIAAQCDQLNTLRYMCDVRPFTQHKINPLYCHRLEMLARASIKGGSLRCLQFILLQLDSCRTYSDAARHCTLQETVRYGRVDCCKYLFDNYDFHFKYKDLLKEAIRHEQFACLEYLYREFVHMRHRERVSADQFVEWDAYRASTLLVKLAIQYDSVECLRFIMPICKRRHSIQSHNGLWGHAARWCRLKCMHVLHECGITYTTSYDLIANVPLHTDSTESILKYLRKMEAL